MTRSRVFLSIAAVAVLALAAVVVAVWRRGPVQVAPEVVSSATCVRCHASEAAGYGRTGMAHAFSLPEAATTVGAPAAARVFDHAASRTSYTLTSHDGRFFERRWQQGFDGRPENTEELQIDFVMGSGNHVRTYLHREQDGSLVELPLAWYAEDSGHWGMNPGFDNTHPMTRRPIAYECMFCHNGFPEIPAVAHRDLPAEPVYVGAMPTGIDCVRCHGPGAAHVKAAETPGVGLERVRAAILNPARLSNERKMEVCEQCHLETTSRPLPDRIRHYEREPFSYVAGQPLAEFNSYFERDAGKGSNDHFEIVSAPYRLRQSKCYLKSQGALTCESCHNPHDLHKGPQSAGFYAGVCMQCHAATLPAKIALKQHPAGTDCVSCHMPKRRTEDVVHAVMTDHLIQRRPPPAGVLLAAMSELPETAVYRGPVKPYVLEGGLAGGQEALYEAAAQVIDSSNLEQGIPALAREIQRQNPARPEFSIELGDAMRHNGDLAGAIDAYRHAMALDPLSDRAQRRLGVALGSAGKLDEGLAALRASTARTPGSAVLWYEQALLESKGGSPAVAVTDLRHALDLKPDFADAQNTLGSLLAQAGDVAGAERAFREAMNVNPYDAGIRSNLARVLGGRDEWKEAAFQFGRAVELDPGNATAHTDYAVALMQTGRAKEAEGEARAALKIKPDDATAQLDLGLTLMQQGQANAGRSLLERAARSGDAQIAGRARMILAEGPGR